MIERLGELAGRQQFGAPIEDGRRLLPGEWSVDVD